MRVTAEQRRMMDAIRDEVQSEEDKERLVDVMVSKATAINIQGLLHETAFSTIPTDVLVTYTEEAVRALCGTRGQNRRSLRVLAELVMITQLAATRMFCDSGSPDGADDLQQRTQLAISLTAETRRLVALLEQMRQGLEDRYDYKKRERASERNTSAVEEKPCPPKSPPPSIKPTSQKKERLKIEMGSKP